MKTNYFLRQILGFVVMCCSLAVYAEDAVITPTFTHVPTPVVGADGPEQFTYQYQGTAAWGDFNNDGYLDLITVGTAEEWNVTTCLYKNNGDGTFTKMEHPFPNLYHPNATWLDFDNDGNLDLFIAGRNGSDKISALFRNMGEGSNYEFEEVFIGEFEYVSHGGGSRSTRYIAVGDYNNDGWVDIYLQGNTSVPDDEPATRVSVLYKNLGMGMGFEKINNPVNGEKPFVQMNAGTAVWADLNNDGYLDLIASGYNNKPGKDNPELADYPYPDLPEGYCGVIYRNNGDGTFAEPITFRGTEEGDVAVTDFNQDGWLDFIVTGVGANSEGWYWITDINMNTGEDGFTFTRYPGGGDGNGMPNWRQGTSISLGDVNNDGFVDVLYQKGDPNALFLNNLGDNTFTRYNLLYNYPQDDGEIKTYETDGGVASLADYDRDNDLDAFTSGDAGGWAPKPGLLRNDLGEGIPVNQAPSIPTGLKVSALDEETGFVTFSWNPSTDDITPQQALGYNLYLQREGSDEISFVLPADIETGLLKVNENLTSIHRTFYKMKDLDIDANYTFGVQAIDDAKVSSNFATLNFKAGTSTGIASVKDLNVQVIGGKGVVVINSSKEASGKVEVYNVSGKIVFSSTAINSTINLPVGVYVVKVATADGLAIEKVLVK
jgi:hypothetical protein